MFWWMMKGILSTAVLAVGAGALTADKIKQICDGLPNKTVVIGMVTKGNAELTLQRWRPTFEDYLISALANFGYGCRTRLVPLGFDTYEDMTATKAIDIIFPNPTAFQEMKDKYGVEEFLSVTRKFGDNQRLDRFGGVIVRSSSRFQDVIEISDIKKHPGMKVCAVNPNAFGGWHIQWYEMIKHGIDVNTDVVLNFTGKHELAMEWTIVNKECDIGIARTETIERLIGQGKFEDDDVFTLSEKGPAYDFPQHLSTELYPEWPLAALSHVPREITRIIAVPLLNIKPDSDEATAGDFYGFSFPYSYQPVKDMFIAIDKAGTGECYPGFFRQGVNPGLCKPCAPGTFSERGLGACVPCPMGTVNNGTANADCKFCPPGLTTEREGGVDGDCKEPQRSSCPDGQVFVEALGACGCRAGSMLNGTDCMPCPAGVFAAEAGSTMCESCSPGRYVAVAGQTECQQCPPGTYAPDAGSENCLDCSASVAGSTSPLGATAESQCLCAENTFDSRQYMSTKDVQPQCLTCPTGVTCNGFRYDKQTNSYMSFGDVLKPGYYADPLDLGIGVFKCTSDVACPGQKLPGDSPCAQNFQGLNCGLCQDGYGKNGNSCEKCASDGGTVFIIMVGGVILFLALGCFHHLWTRRAARTEALDSALPSVTLGTIINFIQTLGVFDQLRIGWPQEFKDLMSPFAFLLLDLNIFGIGCLVPESLVTSYLSVLCLPALVVVIFLVWYFISHVLSWYTPFPKYKFCEIQSSMGMCSQALYISMVVATVSTLECYSSPNGVRALRKYSYVECGSDEHHAVLPATILALLVYVVGLLALFIWLAAVAPKRYGDMEFKVRVRFLMFKFHSARWWYSITLTVRSLALALVPVMIPDSGQQQFILMNFIIVGGLVVHTFYLPYSDKYANLLEATELSLLIIILGLGSWFIMEKGEDRDASMSGMISTLLMASFAICLLSCGAMFVFTMWQALFPHKVADSRRKEVQKLVDKLVASCQAMASAETEELHKLFTACSYLDRRVASQLADFSMLELHGIMPGAISARRLPLTTVNYVMSSSRASQERLIMEVSRSISNVWLSQGHASGRDEDPVVVSDGSLELAEESAPGDNAMGEQESAPGDNAIGEQERASTLSREPEGVRLFVAL